MITIHQRNWKVSNDTETFSKSTQNSLPWVLPDKYITDWLPILSILSLFILLIPYSSHPQISHCLQNVMFCFHWWLTIHQWTEFSISNSTYIQISCDKYIPLLCSIWPDFHTEKFLVLPTKSWNDTNTCLEFTIFLDDKIRDTVQLITYTVPQNSLSIFTIHHNSQFTLNTVRFSSEVELQFFFLEGRHLSKIRLGASVTKWETWYYLASFGVEFCSFLLLLYHPPVTLNSSFSNITIPSQRLVTTSASLRTETWITLSYSSSPKHKESVS